MADAGKMGRNSTTGSALMILLLVIAAAAIGIFLFMNPEILADLFLVAIVIVVAIVVLVAIIYFVMALVSVPYYAVKGEEYQTGATYDLDDVQPVKETNSDDQDE